MSEAVEPVKSFEERLRERGMLPGQPSSHVAAPATPTSGGYLDAAVDGESNRVATAQPGTRNDTLFKAAARLGELVAGAGLDRVAVETALTSAGLAAGLNDLEIAKTIRSGIDTGMQQPRAPKNTTQSATVLEPFGHWSEVLPGSDLAGLMRGGIVEPRRLCDGMLYPGTLHSLAGEPEAGKTTIAAWWANRLIAAGSPVIWMDEESGRESIADRLLALGADPNDVHHGLHYVEFPGLAWTDQHVAALRGMLEDIKPALIVFDSAAGFLGAAGLGENDNDATGGFYKRVLLRAARHANTAVLVLDHVAKTTENGNRYARGAGSKLGFVDVAYSLERIRPFSRAESGALRLVVRKDRRGWLHRQHDIVVNVVDGRIDIHVDESEPSVADSFGPAARKLVEALTDSSQPMTNNELVDAVVARHGHGLTRETVSREMNALLKAGLVDCLEDGFRGAKRWLLATNSEGVMSRDEQ